MERVSCDNQSLGLRKFIPVQIRPSEPTLEKCYIPTANSAYLRITDSITSVTSLTTSAVDSEDQNKLFNNEQAGGQVLSSKYEDPLAAPLSRLLVSQDYSDNIQINQRNPSNNNVVPSSIRHPPVSHPNLPLSHDRQTTKVPQSTLNRLLTAPLEMYTPTDTRSKPCASCGFLEYIQQKASVEKSAVEKPVLRKDSDEDEPSFNVTLVKISEKEMIKTAKKKTVDSAKHLDPYINSVNMLTALVSQNASLVKTALDAISAAAIRPQQQAAAPLKEPNVVHQSDLLQNSQVTPTAQKEKNYQKTKLSRIPRPEVLPATLKNKEESILIDTDPTHKTPNINAKSDLIGVPIKASEYMSKEPAFDFLNALLVDDGHDLPEVTGGPATIDPFLQNLVSTASKLDEFIDDICEGVEKSEAAASVDKVKNPQHKTSGARKLVRKH